MDMMGDVWSLEVEVVGCCLGDLFGELNNGALNSLGLNCLGGKINDVIVFLRVCGYHGR